MGEAGPMDTDVEPVLDLGTGIRCRDRNLIVSAGNPEGPIVKKRRRTETKLMQLERVTIHDAVRITGICVRTLQNLAAQGLIPGAAKPVGRWTFDITLLRKWAQQTPGKPEKWQRTYISEATSTTRVSRLPDDHTASLYMSVLSLRSGPKRRLSAR